MASYEAIKVTQVKHVSDSDKAGSSEGRERSSQSLDVLYFKEKGFAERLHMKCVNNIGVEENHKSLS